MDLLEQRLTNLWLRHTTPSNHPAPEAEPEQFPNRMGVTFREPTRISDTMLTPGRYVFLLPDPGAEPNHLEIFKDDQTTLVANMTLGALQFSDGTWEAGTAWTSMVQGPRPTKRINRPAECPPPNFRNPLVRYRSDRQSDLLIKGGDCQRQFDATGGLPSHMSCRLSARVAASRSSQDQFRCRYNCT